MPINETAKRGALSSGSHGFSASCLRLHLWLQSVHFGFSVALALAMASFRARDLPAPHLCSHAKKRDSGTCYQVFLASACVWLDFCSFSVASAPFRRSSILCSSPTRMTTMDTHTSCLPFQTHTCHVHALQFLIAIARYYPRHLRTPQSNHISNSC